MVGFYYVPDQSQFLSWGVPAEDYPGLYRSLTEKDLGGKDDWTLYLMENEILARSGKPFEDPQLRQYFQAKCWYRADDDYRSPADLEGWNRIRRYRLKR